MKRVLILLAACKPDLGAPASLVTEPRLLAVQSEPAEVPPNTQVALQALVVGPDGDMEPDVAWGFCADPAPLADDNVAADDCIYGAVSIMPRGTNVTATIRSWAVSGPSRASAVLAAPGASGVAFTSGEMMR